MCLYKITKTAQFDKIFYQQICEASKRMECFKQLTIAMIIAATANMVSSITKGVTSLYSLCYSFRHSVVSRVH